MFVFFHFFTGAERVLSLKVALPAEFPALINEMIDKESQ